MLTMTTPLASSLLQVSKSGDQKRLTQKYEAYKPPSVTLVSFDFNHECRHLRYDRLSLLLDRLPDEDWEKIGYFAMNLKDGVVMKKQKG